MCLCVCMCLCVGQPCSTEIGACHFTDTGILCYRNVRVASRPNCSSTVRCADFGNRYRAMKACWLAPYAKGTTNHSRSPEVLGHRRHGAPSTAFLPQASPRMSPLLSLLPSPLSSPLPPIPPHSPPPTPRSIGLGARSSSSASRRKLSAPTTTGWVWLLFSVAITGVEIKVVTLTTPFLQPFPTTTGRCRWVLRGISQGLEPGNFTAKSAFRSRQPTGSTAGSCPFWSSMIRIFPSGTLVRFRACCRARTSPTSSWKHPLNRAMFRWRRQKQKPPVRNWPILSRYRKLPTRQRPLRSQHRTPPTWQRPLGNKYQLCTRQWPLRSQYRTPTTRQQSLRSQYRKLPTRQWLLKNQYQNTPSLQWPSHIHNQHGKPPSLRQLFHNQYRKPLPLSRRTRVCPVSTQDFRAAPPCRVRPRSPPPAQTQSRAAGTWRWARMTRWRPQQ